MKQILLFILTTILFGCNSSIDNSKLTVGKVTVMSKNKSISKNEFAYGESFSIAFDKVAGLTNIDGKVFPEALIYILNENKDTIETINNIFNEDGLEELTPNLNVELMAVLSEATSKNYELKLKVIDGKGDKYYDYAMPFSIKPNDNFFIRNDGLDFANIYLLDNNTEKVIINNIITAKQDLVIIYEGLEGFEVDDINFIYPAASVKMVDAEGTVLIEESNMLKNYEALGFNYEEAFNNFPIDIDFDKANAISPVKLSIELYDLKSSNKLELETKLTLK